VTGFTVDDEAEAELVATGDWYHANARPGVATRFQEAIERAFSELTPAAPERVTEAWKGSRAPSAPRRRPLAIATPDSDRIL
jgi:hypothetical protein